MMKGHPATGKSSLARALARRLAWPLIDKDDVKDHTLHLPAANTIAYEISWQIAETQLEVGLGVIVDSPLSYEVAYSAGCTIAARQGIPCIIVETQLDETRWRERFMQRGERAESAHKISSWRDMQDLLIRYDGCWAYPIPRDRHLVIDSGLPVEQQLDNVMNFLCSKHQESNQC